MSSKGGSKRLSNGLTLKENKFKDKVIEQIREGKSPNGTQAALQVYDTKDYETAKAIASENLAKPHINKSILEEMEAVGLTRNKLFEKLNKVVDLDVEKNAEVVSRTSLSLLKLTDLRENQNHNTLNINISFAEAKKELAKMNSELEEFIVDADS